MKVSLNWLSDYVDIGDIALDEIVDKLTTSGLEVEEVIDEAKNFENIVVGLVKEVKKHPNADKLSLCIVNDGKDDYQVICGAPNVAPGQKTAFAKVGAYLPSVNLTLKKAKIRGVESFGMLCAEDELGLSDNHEGIMVLDDDVPVGAPLSDVLNKNDVILDIAITPNRADALSHVGIARDLGALFGRPLKLPEVKLEESENDVNGFASVEIENVTDCPRYVAKVITNVTIKESPEWLKRKLTAVGLRPINNVVDATNFVLYELGQPLHAFDLDKLAGKKIIVKNVEDGYKFITLDSKERELKSTDLMICDAERPVAIAGVMGGENSEVSSETKNILIESAYFNPSAIRKTAKRLGMSTDASYRFERGCNPEITEFAAERVISLIHELGGGEIAKGTIDVYPNKLTRPVISLRFERLNKVLGFEIEPGKVKSIFNALEFEVVDENEEKITVEIPLFRHDLEREIDLIEEVVRIYGFDKIPLTEKIQVALEEKIDQTAFNGKVRDYLTALGFYEIVTNSLLNEKSALYFGKAIPVLNPQSIEMTHARTSLIPGILSTIERNIRVKEKNLKLFEIGHTFEAKTEKEIESFDDIEELDKLTFAVTGKRKEDVWYTEDLPFDFYDISGAMDEILRKLGVKEKFTDSYILEPDDIFLFRLEKKFKKNIVAVGGKVKQELLKEFNISQDVYLFDVNLEVLRQIHIETRKFNELLKFPKIVRDFAFIFDKDILYETVVKEIQKSSSKLLKKIKLFDIFESDSLGRDKKSMAFQVEYYDENRTLTEEEIDKEFWKTIEHIKSKFKAELRG